jgi:hypothetical protein
MAPHGKEITTEQKEIILQMSNTGNSGYYRNTCKNRSEIPETCARKRKYRKLTSKWKEKKNYCAR